VASDQSKLGGSVPRLTRKCLPSFCGAGLQAPITASSAKAQGQTSERNFNAFNNDYLA